MEHALEINVVTYQAALDLCDRPYPQSVYEAKFSLQHCVAQALLTGHVDLSTFDDRTRENTAKLAEKIHLACVAQYENAYPQNWGTAIEVLLADGTSISQQTDNASGDPEAPLNEAELTAKANGLFAHVGLAEPGRFIAQIKDLESDAPVPDIFSLIS